MDDIPQEGPAPSKDPADAFGNALCEALSKIEEDERYVKHRRNFIDEIRDQFQYYIIDSMADSLEMLVRDMCDRAVEAMLRGQPEQVRRYLKLDGWTGRDYDHPVIHGKLSVPQTMELRRQIAEANEKLLRDEVFKDFDSQIAALVRRNNEQEATIRKLRDDLNEARGGCPF